MAAGGPFRLVPNEDTRLYKLRPRKLSQAVVSIHEVTTMATFPMTILRSWQRYDHALVSVRVYMTTSQATLPFVHKTMAYTLRSPDYISLRLEKPCFVRHT